MPIFEVESNGQVYEVDAPDAQTAASALTRGRPEPDPVRAKAEADTAAANARIAQQSSQNGPDWLRETVRQVGRALTLPARGIVGTGAMIEQGLTAPIRAIAPNAPLPQPFTDAYQALSPPELAARDNREELVDRVGEGAGGMLTGRGVAEQVIKTGGNVAQRVARTVMDNPGREAVGVVTGSIAGQAASDAGANPTGELLATVAGGAPAMIGAKPSAAAGFDPAPVNPRPMGEAAARARQANFKLTPDAVTTQRQMEAPLGVRPGDAPGKLTAQVVGPEGTHATVIENQKNADALAMRELGVDQLSPERLQAEAARYNGPYNELVRVSPTLQADDQLRATMMQLGAVRRNNPWLQSNPKIDSMAFRMSDVGGSSMQDALTAIRELRRESRVLYQSLDDPKKLQAAEAYRAAADALEAGIDRQVGTLFPELVPQMRAARQAQAKIHNVEDSLVGGSGNYHVDPGVLAKIGEKAPLSGWLKEIADFHNNFPQLSTSKVGSSNPSFQMSSPGAAGNPRHWFNRTIGERFLPRMLSDNFQDRFGRVQPGYDPNAPAFSPVAPAAAADGLPFDPTPNVMPPQQGGPGGLGEALDPMAPVDTLPPADAFPGDLTADTPPMGGSEVGAVDFTAGPRFDARGDSPPVQVGGSLADFLVGGGYDSVLGREPALAGGLEVPPSRFTAGDTTFDNGMDFTIDPSVNGASIVRGGADPRTVQDSLLSEELIARPGENLGRPLDFDTADRIAPLDEEMVTRPAPGLGEEFELVREPGADVEPYVAQGEFIQGTPPPRQRPGKFDNAEDAIGPDQLPPPPDAPLGDQFGGPPRLPAPESGSGGATFDDFPDTTLPVSDEAVNIGRGIGRRIVEGKKAARATGGDKLDPNKSAADYAADLAELRESKPRSLKQRYGERGPSPTQLLEHQGQMRAWNAKYRKASELQKAALERDNAAFRERSLGDELTLEDDSPRADAPELGVIEAAPLPEPSGKTASGLDVYENVPPNAIPGVTTFDGSTVLMQNGPTGRVLVLEPTGPKEVTLRWTSVDDGSKGKGLGIGQLLDAIRLAEKRKQTFNMDTSVTTKMIDSLEKGYDKGLYVTREPPDFKLMRERAAKNGGVAVNPDKGAPWIRGMKLGPAG